MTMGCSPRRSWTRCLLAFVVSAGTLTCVPVPPHWLAIAFPGCWISVIASAATAHLPCRLHASCALAFALNDGLWFGLLMTNTPPWPAALVSLGCLPVLALVATTVHRSAGIVAKVCSSWLIAAALLAGALELLPVTPGFLPDHLD